LPPNMTSQPLNLKNIQGDILFVILPTREIGTLD